MGLEQLEFEYMMAEFSFLVNYQHGKAFATHYISERNNIVMKKSHFPGKKKV